MTSYGYARVSTRDQDLAAQVADLQAAGCRDPQRERERGENGPGRVGKGARQARSW